MITGVDACMDYVAGIASFTLCLDGESEGPTLQQCETDIASCTTADVAAIDGVGVCLEDLGCDSNIDDEADAGFRCLAPTLTLSIACENAGQPDGGVPEDPDGGREAPDGGSGETTTTGGSGG